MHALIAQAQDLSAAQLVALYNTYAEIPVKKFASRAIGIKRFTEVIQNALAAQVEQNQEVASMNAMTETRIALDASDKVETRNAIDASDFDPPSITDLEHRVLAGVAESDFQDGQDPEDCKLVWSFSVTQFLEKKRSAGGVIASLVKKGLLTHTPKNGDTDECVAFTQLGAKVFRAVVQTQALPVVEKKAKKATRKALDASDPVKRFALDASDPIKAKRAKKEKAEKVAREPSKVEVMFAMIQEEGGALKSELLKVCGWKGCAVSLGRICEKNNMELSKAKLATGDWTYKAIAKA